MKKEALQTLNEQLRLPVISAPMFLVSGPELVIEACKNGIIGSFPLLNARTDEILEKWMKKISEELDEARAKYPAKKTAPWAVNLIIHHSNNRFESNLDLIKKYEPPIVITSLGNPQGIAEIVHSYGGLVFSDVTTLRHAKKAAESGVDGLILVCNGAGGHGGVINPFAFMGAVRKFWDGMIILAGCITTGEDILAAQALGADFAYMGTRFITTEESAAPTEYKNMIVESTSEDILYTDAFSGVNGNYLIPSIKKSGIDPTNIEGTGKLDFTYEDSSKIKAWKDIWSAGQGVNGIDNILPLSQTINQLISEYEEGLSQLKATQEIRR